MTIEGNTIENSPGGLQVSVAQLGPGESTGILFLTATIEDNTFEWTQTWLNGWATVFYGLLNGSDNVANSPNDNPEPPTITVGSGFSPDGGARIPATVGGAAGYVDPTEISLTIEGNTAEIQGSSGPPQVVTEPTGQVYAGVINGVVSPTSPFPYDDPNYHIFNNPAEYAPFDADNLNITGSLTDSLSITALSWSTTVGSAWSGDVATLTDTDTSTPSSSFIATIYWGDGVTQTGVVEGSDGSFTVVGRTKPTQRPEILACRCRSI